MSAYESVGKLVKDWKPQPLPSELKYRDSLLAHLREGLKDAKMIESEFRHLGTTIDIYVKQAGFWGESEVFVELKRNLISKAQLDRLVGQIESLNLKKNAIIVVLCGETNPALLARLKERYGLSTAGTGRIVIREYLLHVEVKEPLRKKA